MCEVEVAFSLISAMLRHVGTLMFFSFSSTNCASGNEMRVRLRFNYLRLWGFENQEFRLLLYEKLPFVI